MKVNSRSSYAQRNGPYRCSDRSMQARAKPRAQPLSESGGCGDDCVELFPLFERCKKRERFTVGCYNSRQIVKRRGVFSDHASGYLGVR